MIRIILFSSFFLLMCSCTKKQLKETTITLYQPMDQQVYHHNDTVVVKADISYKKDVNDIAFFIAMDNQENDSNFYKRTILPTKTPYTITDFYVNEFTEETNVTVSYGKRNVKSGQIYEIKTLELTFLP